MRPLPFFQQEAETQCLCVAVCGLSPVGQSLKPKASGLLPQAKGAIPAARQLESGIHNTVAQ